MIPDNINKLIKFESYPPYKTGGQSVGTIHTGCKLICEEAGYRVEVKINKIKQEYGNTTEKY